MMLTTLALSWANGFAADTMLRMHPAHEESDKKTTVCHSISILTLVAEIGIEGKVF
jgi:hypothetical protein